MNALLHCWHPVAWSSQVTSRRPLGVEVLGRRVVTFRDERGRAVVLDDMCPHKNVPLSPGKLERGKILCPYHGWKFDGAGRCADIPSLCRGERIPEHIAVKSYAVREELGTVWFTFSDTPFEPEPPTWHHPETAAFTTVQEMDCEYVRLMENLVDNPHAGFLHAGLLRGRPRSHVTSTVRETERGVHIATAGETAHGSMIYRLLRQATRSEEWEIVHTEEYLDPNIIRTTFGDKRGRVLVTSQFVCTPVHERRTRVFYRITIEFPLIARALLLPMKRMVDEVIRQDGWILEQEAKVAWAEPERKRIPTASDAASLWVAAAARRYAQDGPQHRERRGELREKTVEYRL